MTEAELHPIVLREATSVDAPPVVTLITALARVMDVVTPVDEAYVRARLEDIIRDDDLTRYIL